MKLITYSATNSQQPAPGSGFTATFCELRLGWRGMICVDAPRAQEAAVAAVCHDVQATLQASIGADLSRESMKALLYTALNRGARSAAQQQAQAGLSLAVVIYTGLNYFFASFGELVVVSMGQYVDWIAHEVPSGKPGVEPCRDPSQWALGFHPDPCAAVAVLTPALNRALLVPDAQGELLALPALYTLLLHPAATRPEAFEHEITRLLRAQEPSPAEAMLSRVLQATFPPDAWEAIAARHDRVPLALLPGERYGIAAILNPDTEMYPVQEADFFPEL